VIEDLERGHSTKVLELAEVMENLNKAKQQQRALADKLRQAQAQSQTDAKKLKSMTNDVSGLHDAVEYLERGHSAKVLELAEVMENLKF
jgi:uncharacterized phage infection (PIP) family protein YhgE